MEIKKIADDLRAKINTEMDEIINRILYCEDEVLPISEIAAKQSKSGDRFSTGFSIFDDAMEKGFKYGDLVIISGVSGHGKTSLAQTLTYNFCKNSIPCLWFSYEVNLVEINKKFISMGISNFYYAYAPKKNTTGQIEWVASKINESWKKYNTKVVFIDDIDCLTPLNVKSFDNETIILKKIAQQLKDLAIKLDIVIICMAQLKKLPDNKEPEMQDIAQSAGIFQKADYVFMIYREKEKRGKFDEGNLYTNNSIIKIVKNRQTGVLKYLKVNYSNGKFLPITNQEEPISRMDYINN